MALSVMALVQTNMMRVANSPENLVWYSVSTRKADVMILDD